MKGEGPLTVPVSVLESEFVVKVGSADDSAPHMERIKHSGEVQFDLALESLANPEVCIGNNSLI